MKTLVYDINEHLGAADRRRLKAAAESAGCSIDDYVEATLKRALYGAGVRGNGGDGDGAAAPTGMAGSFEERGAAA